MSGLFLRFLLPLGLAGMLSGCGSPAAWAPVIAAGLGLGTAVVSFETESLRVENDREVREEGLSAGP